MSATPTLEGHLATLSRVELSALLMHRPATVFGWTNRNLRDLAEIWVSPWSMVQSMVSLSRPALQVLETLAALAQGVSVDVLSDRLEQTGSATEHRDNVLRALRSLQDHALAWVGPDQGIWISCDIDEIHPRPLGLGPGVDRDVRHLTVEEIKRILTAVGLPTGGKRDELVRRLLDFYLDADRIVAVVDSAPDEILQDLRHWLVGLSPRSETYDRANHDRVENSFHWARNRGLIFGYHSYEAEVPAPVVIALRRSEFRAAFRPAPPDLALADRPRKHVDTTAGTAAIYFDSLCMSVLDVVASPGLPLLAKGGVGVRELAKLADRIKATPDEVRTVLELAFAAELLQRRDSQLTTGPTYRAWQAAEPADRIAELIAAWWNLGHFPSAYRGADGKAQPALQEMSRGGEDADIRHRVVQLLADLPRSGDEVAPCVTDQGAFAARVTWAHPMVIGPRSAVPLALWSEGHLLGVLAEGACTPVGRALLAGDGEGLRAAVGAVLPAAATTGSFGSDLTVMVAGAPTAAAAQLLDACADRESRGQASLWRFSPASVRRAFDHGWVAPSLVEALQDIASAALPQTLTYLIGDVARQHGRIQVATAGCCLLSTDTALLTEVCAARPLRHLGLRMLAPTVAVSTADAETTVAALRTAGYMPVPEGGALVVGRRPSLETSERAPLLAGSDHIGKLLAATDHVPVDALRRQVEKVTQRVFRGAGATAEPKPPTLFS
jgi:hypothetical protein